MKTTRLDSGYYQIVYKGRTFTAETVERATEGESRESAWILREDLGTYGNEDFISGDGYWNHYYTLRDCKEDVRATLDTEASNVPTGEAK